MKVNTGTLIEKAVREFTDREEPRASFWKKYRAVKSEIGGEANVHVLTYYGIGGIGKTSLVKRLMKEMNQRIESPISVYQDFAISSDLRRVLYSLKCKLAEEGNFTFPLLELGLYVYAKKVGEKADSPEIQRLTEKSPLLSFMLSIAENIPVLGLATKVLSLADKGSAFIRNYLRMHSKELSRIEHMEPEDLYNHLPMLFALDMRQNVKQATEPVVIFLDSYEQLVNEMSQIGDPLKNDEWIRSDEGLVQNIPGVLWVITGREKLKWVRFDSGWSDALEQHLLGSLSMTDSVHFLERAGIGQKELRDQLYALTQGTPIFLDLCVDQYYRLVNRGETPHINQFGENTLDLTERFVRYMGDIQKDHVYFLACLRSWSPALVEEIAEVVLPNFSITTYDKIKEYSFVVMSDDLHYHIQQTVGEVLLKTCSDAIKKRTGKALLDRFTPIVQKRELFTAAFADALLYVAQGALLFSPDRETLLALYEKYLKEPLDAFLDAGQFRQAKVILELLTHTASENKTDRLYAEIMYANACLERLSGHYPTSLNYAEEVWQVYHALLGDNHPDTIRAMGNMAISLGALGRHEEALEKKTQVLEKRRHLLGDNHLSTVWAMHNLAVTLGILNRYEEACDLQSEVLDKRRRLLGDDHTDTIWAMLNLSVTLGQLDKHQEAMILQTEVLKKRRVLLGENHPDTVWAMHHLAITLSKTDRVSEASKLLETVLEKRRLILGEEHPDTLLTVNELSKLRIPS